MATVLHALFASLYEHSFTRTTISALIQENAPCGAPSNSSFSEIKMLKQNPSFVVIGTKVRAQSCKNSLTLRDYTLPLTPISQRRKSWKSDVFRVLSSRLDKCNDIQMSRIILCLWGVWSNWILIKYWARETLYLIMQAVPLVCLSGGLQPA